MAIPEDLAEQPRPQRFARMCGNDSAPAIFMTKQVMAATDANNLETFFANAAIRSEPENLGVRLMLPL